MKNQNTASFFEERADIKKIEKKINFQISKDQNFIEYSEKGLSYIKDISKIIKKNTGGLLLIDYGYNEKRYTSSSTY